MKGCLLHFQEVATIGLPLIVYNNPGRTVVKLDANTLQKIGEIPEVCAVKESSHDLHLVRQLKNISPLAILSGEPTTFSNLAHLLFSLSLPSTSSPSVASSNSSSKCGLASGFNSNFANLLS